MADPGGSSSAALETQPRTPLIGSNARDAITLGRLVTEEGIGGRVRYGGDQGVVVFGPNGKGKGTRILMPNLLQMQGASIVVVDPKGELAAVTAPYRRTLGKVVIINPFGVLADLEGYDDLRSAGFNPLTGLDPESRSFNAQASQIADAMVTVEGSDPHWTQSARALTAAMVMWVAIEAKQNGTVPTMARVRELICLPSSPGNARSKMGPVGIPKLAEQMMHSPIAGLRNKAAQFIEWTDEVRSIASAAKIQTEPFDDPEISDDLAKDGFDFRDLKREPITVYLILPPDMMMRHSKWLRLVLTRAIQSLLRARQPGEPKTLFMLDEFFALGHLEIISTVWALVRGYGVQMMPVLQDLNQLKKLYPDLWETFIGMAGAVSSFAPNDLTTAEFLSRRAGEQTQQLPSSSNTETRGGSSAGETWSNSSSTSYAPQKTPLLTPHKIFGLKPGNMLLTLDGLSNITPVYAPPYYDIRRCLSVARDNPYFLGQAESVPVS